MRLKRRLLWRREESASELTVESGDGRTVSIAGLPPGQGEAVFEAVKLPDGRFSLVFPSGRQLTGRATEAADGRIEAWVGGHRMPIALGDPLRTRPSDRMREADGPVEIRARIPGRVVEVRVCPGDAVVPGTTLLVLEAMKMQNEILSESPARVIAVECSAGQAVEAGAVLVRLEVEFST